MGPKGQRENDLGFLRKKLNRIGQGRKRNCQGGIEKKNRRKKSQLEKQSQSDDWKKGDH